MKNQFKIFVPFTIALLLGSLTFAFAQSNGKNFRNPKDGDRRERLMPPPDGGLHPRILERLNLTDAQKEQIQAIQIAARDASKENFDKIRGFDAQLKSLVEGGNFSEEQARTTLNQKAQTLVELEVVRLRAEAAMLKILTAEQKAQFEQLKQQRPEPSRGFRPENRPQN